jgi:hypothetical protein
MANEVMSSRKGVKEISYGLGKRESDCTYTRLRGRPGTGGRERVYNYKVASSIPHSS